MTTDINTAIIELANSIRVNETVDNPSINYKFFKDELPLFSDECWAKLFYDLNKHTYIYNQQHNTWFYYSDTNILKQYKKNAPVFLNNHISKCLQHLLTTEFNKINKDKKYKNEYLRNYKKVGSNAFCKNIISKLMNYYQDDEIFNKIDKNKNLLAFKDCVYDLERNKYRSIEKTDYISNYIKFKLKPNKPINEEVRKDIINFIYGIQETEEDAKFLLKLLANSLFYNKFGLFTLFLGDGGNGKSVLSALHETATSKYGQVVSSQFLTSKYRANAPNSDLYKCMNKRSIIVNEPEENEGDRELQFNISFLKKITDNDTISTREMYESPVEFLADFSIFCLCNNPPKLDSVDDSIKRRFININFPFIFKENPDPNNKYEKQRDYTLKEKFRNNKLYRREYIKLLLEHVDLKKLNPPKKVIEYTNEYLNDNNHTLNFIQEKYEITNNVKDRILYNDLYQEFKSWSSVYLSKSNFKKQMLANKYLFGKVNGRYYFKKLVKKEEDDDEEEIDIKNI